MKITRLLFASLLLSLAFFHWACGSASPPDLGELGAVLPSDNDVAGFPKALPLAPISPGTGLILSNTPPIGTQGTPQSIGSPGSCISWSGAYGLGSYTVNQGRQWGIDDPAHQISPAWMYSFVLNEQTRACPTGTVENDYLNFLVQQGAVDNETVAYQPNCNYLTPLFDQGFLPNPDFMIGNWKFVSPTDRDLIKQLLNEGHALSFAGNLYQGFGQLTGDQVFYGNGPFEVNKKTGQLVGHGMLLIGYDDTLGDPAKGLGAYRIQNSFGTAWGDQGYLWMSYGTFEASIHSAFEADPRAPFDANAGTLLEVSPNDPNLPQAVLTQAYQAPFVVSGAPEYDLVLSYVFSAPLRVAQISVIDPGGNRLTTPVGAWENNSYTYFARQDGNQFLTGNYQIEINAKTLDGHALSFSENFTLNSLGGGNPPPAAPFVDGILGGHRQPLGIN